MSVNAESEKYDKLIYKTLGHHNLKVKGDYQFPDKSETIQVDTKDLERFKTLYKHTGGSQCIGYGEIALYWLYGGKLQPAGEIDLMVGDHKIDVKSYISKGYLTLGKWKDNIKTRNIVNNLFSCYNLMNKDFKSELNFSTSHLEDAIKANIHLFAELSAIYQITNADKRGSLVAVLKTLTTLTEEFKEMAKHRGRVFIPMTNDNTDIIVHESIADIIYGLVSYKLFESPTGIGKNGYIMNVVKTKDGTDGVIDVHRAAGLSKNSDLLHDNFRVVSGEIKIRPSILDHV
jgi:hypothetical protein|tara:strand:- start:24100 stop:24963 length:864 start_codon:yes stop_codon:yes gene_type:complete